MTRHAGFRISITKTVSAITEPFTSRSRFTGAIADTIFSAERRGRTSAFTIPVRFGWTPASVHRIGVLSHDDFGNGIEIPFGGFLAAVKERFLCSGRL